MNLKLIEPLRELFKDEVRLIGRDLGMPERSSFDIRSRIRPGVRILGELTEEKIRIVQPRIAFSMSSSVFRTYTRPSGKLLRCCFRFPPRRDGDL